MSNATLGKLIDGKAQRDAIHLAIAPVVATEAFRPGEHVGVLKDGTISGSAEKKIGIVDPFLESNVLIGQGFYLCLYPKTITDLRHEWSHPELDQSSSRAWMEKYLRDVFQYSYEDGMKAIKEYLDVGIRADDNWAQVDLDPAFWGHYEAITGVKGSGEPFVCCA